MQKYTVAYYVACAIDRNFPKESYSLSSAIEELKTWSSKDLKEFMIELNQTQKFLTKGIMIEVLKDIILFYNDIITYEELIKNRFVLTNIIITENY